MEPRLIRQREWMPDAKMKPPKPTTTTTEDFSDIYAIGLREPVFEDKWKTVRQRLADYEQLLARIADNVANGRPCSDGIPQVGPPASVPIMTERDKQHM